MDNNNNNIKLSPTGGLKIMTVFVVVLVAHVIVLGSITAYYLLKSPSVETDMAADKTHKAAKTDGSLASDGQMPTDTSATASTPTSPLTPPADGAASTAMPAAGTDQTQTASTEGSATTPDSSSSTPSMLSQIPLRTGPVGPVINPTSPLAQNTPLMTESPAEPTPMISPAPTVTPDLAPPPDSVPAPTPYVVKAHDSLAKIARQNHTTVASLKSANSLNSDLLKIGQKLVIPAQAPAIVTATTPDASATAASATENTPAIADQTTATAKTPVGSTPKVAVKTTPAAASGQAATTIASTTMHSHVYTVVKGDTLTKIARKFKTTPSALMAENNIADAAKLSIGKKLKIPSREMRAAKIAEPASQPVQVQAKSNAPISSATSVAAAKTPAKTVATTIPAPAKTVAATPTTVTQTSTKVAASTTSAVDQVQSSLSAPTPTTMGNPPQTQTKSQVAAGEYANFVP